jgi:hypothetical protein
VRFGVRTPLPDVGLPERALLVKRIGFDGIELGDDWSAKPLEFLQKELEGTGVAVSAIVGSIGLLNTDPEKRAKAIETDRRRLELAKALEAECLIEVPTFGPNRFQDLSPIMNPREIEERLLISALQELAADVEKSGVILLLEPCNHKETHFMYRQSQAAKIIEACARLRQATLSSRSLTHAFSQWLCRKPLVTLPTVWAHACGPELVAPQLKREGSILPARVDGPSPVGAVARPWRDRSHATGRNGSKKWKDWPSLRATAIA